MFEQAAELAAPAPDYEEAAREAGWRVERVQDGAGERDVEFFAWCGGSASDPERETDWCATECEAWRDACQNNGIKPHDREVYEHWAVTGWLADKLIAHGEKVDKDFAGLCVWARTSQGDINADAVLQSIEVD